MKKKIIILITIILAFILIWRAESIWLLTTQSRTMLEFCGEKNSILGKGYTIYCGDKAVEDYLIR